MILSAVPFNPLLTQIFEGLLESLHPYNFISRAAIKDLLTQPNAAQKTAPLIKDIVNTLRLCLQSANLEVVSNGLYGIRYLSGAVGKRLDEFLHFLISQMSKHMSNKKLRDEVIETLQMLETNGVRL